MTASIPRNSILFCLVLLVAAGCGRSDESADIASDEYTEAVAAFYTGIAGMQVGEDRRAEEKLRRVTEIYPSEPAAWANLGLLALRRNEIDLAAEHLERASELAPEDAHIRYLLGLLSVAQGTTDEAIRNFREAVSLDSTNVRAMYALVEQLEQRGADADKQEVRELVDRILALEPANAAVLIEVARLAAIDQDEESVRSALDSLAVLSEEWPESARAQLDAAAEAAEDRDYGVVITQLSFLNNVLKQEETYRESLEVLRTDPNQTSEVVDHFLSLPPPASSVAAPDDSLSFATEQLFPERLDVDWQWVRALVLSAEGLPVVAAASSDSLYLEDGTAIATNGPVSATGLIAFDFDYDFRVDLGMAGRNGFRLLRQREDSAFVDVTAETGLSTDVLRQPYVAGWAADFDMDGDLDVLLATESGPPTVLRNNGDGTFMVWPIFQEASGVRQFIWADFDGDGDPDAAIVEASGRFGIMENLRSRGFRYRELGDGVTAVTTADLDSDGILEMIVLHRNGRVERIQQAVGTTPEQRGDLVRLEGGAASAVDGDTGESESRIFAMDVDNNGAIDLIVSGSNETVVWLSDGASEYRRLEARAAAATFSVADITGVGRLDLIGVDPEGAPVRLGNRGTKNYHSKSIRPQAANAAGDQRINPFGLGGEIEVRAGTLFQKQAITDPVVHFGIGENLVVDVARIIWPNGDVQAEFELLSDETVQARQRLKGSCPWLFTFDGEEMRFVTDFIWRSPLGLRINAQETAGIMMTEDWVKIEGSELRPRDGVYDVRITAELWETHFFDHVSLMAVDHPEGTEVWVDERFAFPPPELAVKVTGPRRPIVRAVTGSGVDVTESLQSRDDNYHAAYELGQYQGVAGEHALIVDLGELPRGPVYLLADGWVRPTDSSINVAISQGSHEPPRGLRLEVPDGRGGWEVLHENLGFPAGKHKTIVVDLTGAFDNLAEDPIQAGESARVRLTTNLEIYWDALHWAEAAPDVKPRLARLDPDVAELRYRGFSMVSEPERSRPEVPVYDSLQGTAQIWQDLEGYYTRFGDVRELLLEIDDRYVIMNAGDELALEFRALPEPPEGWVRDFVVIGDGWVKDGDYNTSFSETVLPLPSHDQPEYDTPPGRLEEDPVYRRHQEDWQRFHTRYVAPRNLRAAMRF